MGIAQRVRAAVRSGRDRVEVAPAPVVDDLPPSLTIGILTFSLSQLGDLHTIASVTAAAARAGCSTALYGLRAATTDDIDQGISRLIARKVDALVVVEAEVLETPEFSVPSSVPLVVTDCVASQGYPAVSMDQVDGAWQATDHLLDLGHRTVHHLAGPAGSRVAWDRTRAWRASLRHRGRSVPQEFLGDWTPLSGYRAGQAIMERPRGDVTAVFCANDQMALGLMRAFHEGGVRVPDDISVVGFDDVGEAEFFWPPLTTVRQDFDQVGVLCVGLLTEELRRRALPPEEAAQLAPVETAPHLVPVELVVRASTGPPRR